MNPEENAQTQPQNETPEPNRFLHDTLADSTSKAPDRVIVPGEDGDMIARPLSEVAAEQGIAEDDDEGMELFITEEVKRDKDAWNSKVRVPGSKTIFKIRELDEDEKEALNFRQTQGLADHLGIPLAFVEVKTKFQQKLKEIPNGSVLWTNYQVETNLNICLEHVKGWIHDPKAKAKPPFSLDIIREAMAPSVRFKLAQAIIEKSTIGASQSDFLEPS